MIAAMLLLVGFVGQVTVVSSVAALDCRVLELADGAGICIIGGVSLPSGQAVGTAHALGRPAGCSAEWLDVPAGRYELRVRGASGVVASASICVLRQPPRSGQGLRVIVTWAGIFADGFETGTTERWSP